MENIEGSKKHLLKNDKGKTKAKRRTNAEIRDEIVKTLSISPKSTHSVSTKINVSWHTSNRHLRWLKKFDVVTEIRDNDCSYWILKERYKTN